MDASASGTKLRVLIVEDSEDDAKLVLRELRRGGYAPTSERVYSAAAMQAALVDGSWEIVLCDYVMPGFGALEALKILKDTGFDLPFIVVSGKIGEDTAVEAMRAGAHDYVMKSNLQRLAPAIARELVEARSRRERRRADVEVQRMHAQMAQAHKEWLQAFDSVSDPIFLHDRDYRIMRANRAYAQRAGCEFKDFSGKHYWEVFPKGDGPLPGCIETMERGALAVEEIEYDDGTIFLSRTSPIKDANGAYLYSIHVMQDITASKRAEAALERNERYYRKLIEGGSDVFFVLDPAGTVRFRSAAGRRLTGYDNDEVIGREVTTFVAPASLPVVRQAIAQTLKYPNQTIKVEVQLERRDGSCVDVEVIGRNLLADPDVDGIVVTARDITERKRSERARAELAAIVSSSIDAIYSVDAQNNIAVWNASAERLYGYGADDVLNRPVSLLAPADLQGQAMELHARVLRGEEIRAFETARVRKDGTLFDVAMTFSPVRDSAGAVVSVSVIAQDITERKRGEVALRRLNRSLRTLSAGNETLVRASDEAGLLREMVRIIREVGGYAYAWVGYARDDAKQSIEPKASAGVEKETLRQARISWGDNERGQHVVARAIRLAEVQVVRDVVDDPGFALWRDDAHNFGMGAICALPLKFGVERPFGVIVIVASECDAFDAEELRLLRELASDLAYGIANLRTGIERSAAAEQLRRGLENTIGAIAATVEMRDPYTAGHQRRVAQLAAAIAVQMGLPQQTVEGVRFGARIHDLGKIQVPAEILAKPTRLSGIEMQLINAHAQSGFEIVKDIEFPWPVALMVLQHHERCDGSGYPMGLKADEIVIEARIIAVADVVEAMSSHRPYRPGLGIEAALTEIEENRGSKFDAQAADACLRLFREQHFTFQQT